MQVSVEQRRPAEVQGDVLVVNLFEGEKPEAGPLADVDRATGGAISRGASMTMMLAQKLPLNAITEPQERSIPPEIMTMAAPSAKMPNMAVCRRILTMLGFGSVQ